MNKLTLNGKDYELDDELVTKLTKVVEESNKPTGRWKPKGGDKYWHITDYGEPNSLLWGDYEADEIDRWLYSQRNVFRTEEEAKAHKAYLEAVAELKDSSEFVPDWGNYRQRKWFVKYDHKYDYLNIAPWIWYNYGSLVYFATEADAQKSIKEHESAWLRYFGVK